MKKNKLVILLLIIGFNSHEAKASPSLIASLLVPKILTAVNLPSFNLSQNLNSIKTNQSALPIDPNFFQRLLTKMAHKIINLVKIVFHYFFS